MNDTNTPGDRTNGRDPAARTVCTPEEEALQRLEMLDLDGARAAFEALLTEALRETSDLRDLSHLLYDVLSRVERTVWRHDGLPRHGLRERLVLVRHLHAATSTLDLVARFWGAFEQCTQPLGALTPPGHPAVEQVKTFVRTNYTSKIALAEIARAVGVSRNYLSHLFKRHCGVTVTEYIHRTRMTEAEKLLLNGRRTVSEIAFTVGYQNYRDFHRNFVKYRKTSPKKFRQFRGLARPFAPVPNA
jgi:AraC-like DNA-binding protein